MAEVWIGTSGYVYRHWRAGVFYPPALPPREELAWYAGRFRTVELNNLFAVKVPRVVSHTRRLRETRAPPARFLEAAGELGPKLGPLLVQLPPQFHLHLGTLEDFLATIPPSHRWVLEVRHPSWQAPDVYERLAARGMALCVPVGGRVQPDLVTTADFTYIRMHAGEEPGGGFGEDQLVLWAGRIRALARAGKDVYVYFNNDRGGRARGHSCG